MNRRFRFSAVVMFLCVFVSAKVLFSPFINRFSEVRIQFRLSRRQIESCLRFSFFQMEGRCNKGIGAIRSLLHTASTSEEVEGVRTH